MEFAWQNYDFPFSIYHFHLSSPAGSRTKSNLARLALNQPTKAGAEPICLRLVLQMTNEK